MSEELTLFENLDDIKPIKKTEKVELVDISELELGFEYTPAEIKIKNKEKLEQAMELYKRKYDGYTVTAETFDSDAKVRASLNKLEKQVKGFVKDQLADYNKPLGEVKEWVDNLLDPIKKINDEIDKGVKEFEELERKKRAQTVKEAFREAIDKTGVEIDLKLFTEHFDGFSAKEFFMTDNVRINRNTNKAITDLVAEEVRKKEEYDRALIKITEAAAKADFGPATYLNNFKNGVSLSDILQAIADDKALADKVRAEEKAKNELTKRINEMTAIAQSKGLNPSKYVKMLENGHSALEVHETLITDASNLTQEEETKSEQTSENAENHQKIDDFEQEKASEGNHTTDTFERTEAQNEPNKKITKWQGDFKITFPDLETAKKFGAAGGLYEQYGVEIKKLGEWVKL